MRQQSGVNPSLVPAAFFYIQRCSALALGRGTDISHPWGHVQVPWSGSRAAHDVSWRSAGAAAGTRAFLRKKYVLKRRKLWEQLQLRPLLISPPATSLELTKIVPEEVFALVVHSGARPAPCSGPALSKTFPWAPRVLCWD